MFVRSVPIMSCSESNEIKTQIYNKLIEAKRQNQEMLKNLHDKVNILDYSSFVQVNHTQ